MSGWTLTFYLNKSRGVPYYISEWGSITAEIENVTDRPFHVSEFGIEFDWQKEEERWWATDCSIELAPGEKKSLPQLDFMIDIDAQPKAHTYKLGFRTEELIEEEWKGSKEISWSGKTFHMLIEKHPQRDYKVFISHSNHPDDKTLTDLTHDLLVNCGIEAYVAEKKGEPGEWLWSKIEREIRNSDSFLVLWTKQGAISGDVREEIGIAVGAGKYEQIVPVVEVGEDLKGSLKGKEWALLDRENQKKAITETIKNVLKDAEKKPPILRPVNI